MSRNKSKIEQLTKLIFEQKISTRDDKNRLLKLAKLDGDLEIINKLANDLNFRRAKEYLLSLNHEKKNKKISKNKKYIPSSNEIAHLKTLK